MNKIAILIIVVGVVVALYFMLPNPSITTAIVSEDHNCVEPDAALQMVEENNCVIHTDIKCVEGLVAVTCD